MQAPIKVALLLDSYLQPLWVRKIIADIQASTFAEISLVVLNGSISVTENEVEQPGFIQKLLSRRKDLLYLLYRKVDERLFSVPQDAFQIVDVKEMLSCAPAITVIPRKTAYSDYLESQDAEKIRSYQPDVALRFGFRILRGEFLNIARYGVWSYHHGDNLVNRGGPPGFWEVMEGSPQTGSILQILSNQLDGGKVIYRSYSGTEPFSVHRNKNNYYWKSSAFVLRKLQDLYNRGPQAIEELENHREFQPYSQRLYKQPANQEMLPLLWRWAKRYGTAKLVNALFHYQWFLAYQLEKKDGPAESLYRFKSIIPPKDRFWADPFPFQWRGRYYIFIEDFSFAERKGHVAVIELDEQGNWSGPRPVLERNYHLSYPFVFEWQGDIYMIPESAENRSVELYRCTSFPDQWSLQEVIMSDVTAVDTTLAEIDGSWWMFNNIAQDGASKNEELYLFYADTPLGPWRPHRGNPIKSDVRSARPAGRIFRWNGSWYRPAQDCSATYGNAISINKILRIDKDCYEEREVSKILPQWKSGLIGTHTFNFTGRLTVVDALRKRRKLL